MKKKAVYIMALGAIAILAAGVYYFVREESAVKPPVAQNVTDAPVMTFSGSSIVEEKDGKRVWEMSAENIEIEPSTKKARLVNMKGIFYQKDGGKLNVTATQAAIDSTAKEAVLKGNVKAVDSKGAVLITDQLHWTDKDGRVNATGNVIFTRDDTVIRGDNVETDVNMENIKIKGNARVTKGGATK